MTAASWAPLLVADGHVQERRTVGGKPSGDVLAGACRPDGRDQSGVHEAVGAN